MLDLLGSPTSLVLGFLWRWGPYILAAWTLGTIAMSVYNLYFHPLAKFPGPKFAAASSWWQVWIENITQQSLSLKLVELHEQYGSSDIILVVNKIPVSFISSYRGHRQNCAERGS